jgi:hypothetical protein
VKRADGTTLVPFGAEATNDGTGSFTYTFTADQMSVLDVLTIYWDMVINGVTSRVQTQVEVVGGFLVSLPELAGVMPGNTDAMLAERRQEVEDRLERACARAFRPRYALERVQVRSGPVRLKWGHVRRIRALSVYGTAWSDPAISGLDVDYTFGRIHGLYAIPGWYNGGVIIGYEHGDDYPPAAARYAVLEELTATYGSATATPVDPRIVSQSADNMSVTFASPASSAAARAGELLSPVARSFARSYGAPMVA